MAKGTKLSPAAPKAKAAPPIKANRAQVCGPTGEKSVEIRKIDNGFIVRETSWSKAGKYSSKETYSPKAPTVQLAPAGKK